MITQLRVTGMALLVVLSSCANDSFKKTTDGTGQICQAGEGKCEGEQGYLCAPSGLLWEKSKKCVWPESCYAGACTDPCSLAKAKRSYVGCEYYAVDLENAPSEKGYSAASAQFAIVVSYAGATEHAVRVKIYGMVGGTEKVLTEGDVSPGSIRVFKVGPSNVDGTTQGLKAFRVSAAAPVTAYQFNPLNNTNEAFSNDASLLLPVPSLDREYIAVTGDSLTLQDGTNPNKTYKMGAFVTVVGTRNNTKVTITPTSAIRAGAGIPGGKGAVTRTINRYEVLSVSSEIGSGGVGGNLSGTFVSANQPVAVFSGNGATVTPTGTNQKCCADHLEEQMIPLSSWGKTFVAARTRPRILSGTAEPDWWRITGGAKGIKLTYQPSQPAGAPTTLNKGQSVEFHTTTAFVVEGTGPIMVTQFMASANHTGDMVTLRKTCTHDDHCKGVGFVSACSISNGYCGPVGDPAMTLVPPVEQFRKDYVFLVPDDYFLDYATIIAPMKTKITLDGKQLTQPLTAVGSIKGSKYGILHAVLSDGKHRISATAPVGVMAYGLDSFVSYGYPAGLNLDRINIY